MIKHLNGQVTKIFLDGIESNGDPGNEPGIVRLSRCYRFPNR